jgi:hypothetical protein
MFAIFDTFANEIMLPITICPNDRNFLLVSNFIFDIIPKKITKNRNSFVAILKLKK